MITYFTEEDMFTFGQYLLSDVRTNAVKESCKEDENIENKLKNIYKADFENWAYLNKLEKDGN